MIERIHQATALYTDYVKFLRITIQFNSNIYQISGTVTVRIPWWEIYRVYSSIAIEFYSIEIKRILEECSVSLYQTASMHHYAAGL